MIKIKNISAREILDSRGIPTIEARLIMDNDREVRAAASSGESIGKFEGAELRDGDPNRFDGWGVKKAVSYINDLIGPKLKGVSVDKQTDIDYWLIKADGTENRSKLGVNTLIVISQLLIKAAAKSEGIPLFKYINSVFSATFKKELKVERIPTPIFNVINGGKHGTKNLEFQEFQIVPQTATSFTQALDLGAEIYTDLKKILEYRNAGISVSEEGGFTPNLLTNTDALEIMKEALAQRRLRLGVDVFFGIDFAASQYFKDNKYFIKDKPHPLRVDEYIQYLLEINKEFNILILEDPIVETDFENWRKINEMAGTNTYIVGDDFLAGSKTRLARAIKEKSASAILLKMNQVGTLTEIFEVVNLAQSANFKIIFSHRLGETNDPFIADLAVGIQADFVKFGSPVRGERVAKYNRLLEIEDEIAQTIT